MRPLGHAALLAALAVAPLAPLASQAATASPSASVRRIAADFADAANDDSGTLAWGIASPRQLEDLRRHEDGWAAALADIDGVALYGNDPAPTADWLLYGAIRESIEASRALRVCRFELWNVDQLNGWPAQAEYDAAVRPVATDSQRTALIARFDALPQVAAYSIADLREGVRLGYTAPRPMVDRVIAQLDAMLADTTAKSSLASPAQRSADAPFRARWMALLSSSAYPSMRAYRDYLANEYVAFARPSTSLATLPNGKACYRARLRALTTVDAEPESLVALAATRLVEIRRTIRPVGERLFPGAGVTVAMNRMRTDPKLVMHDADSILSAYRAFVATARAPLPRFFTGIADEPLDVVSIPKAQAAGAAPARYEHTPSGGGSNALLLVNSFQPGGIARMNVAMGTVHEGYPGHHWQFLAAREHATADHAALDAAANSGYLEGWAIYAEVLGEEMGVYQTDLDRIGYLIHQYDVFTALELDAGLHGLGWTRAQVVDSMMLSAGRPRVQAESYADRSAATPAQLASYAVGYLVIAQLRQEAERRLGSRFDVKEFHAQILNSGPMPLPMLQLKLHRWLSSTAP